MRDACKDAEKEKESILMAVPLAVFGAAKLAAKGISKLKGKKGTAKKGFGKGKRRRRKTAAFFAREIVRLKLKRQYDKIRLGGYR